DRHVADIGRVHQALLAPLAPAIDAHGQERRILDTDPDLLDRRYQIRLPVRVFAEDRGEEADQALARHASSLMQPRSVAENFEAGVATMGWIPKLDWGKTLFGRRPVRRAGLEGGDQLLQGRTLRGVEISHDPEGEIGRPPDGNGLKTAAIQARFARMSNVTERDAQAVVGEAERAGETLARVRE